MKNTKVPGPFFLSHTSKPNQQKQRDVVSKCTVNIYLSNKYDFFPIILLLTNHEALYNLNIVLSFHPPFEPITTLFTITRICDLKCSLLYFVVVKLTSRSKMESLRLHIRVPEIDWTTLVLASNIHVLVKLTTLFQTISL